MKIWAIRWLRCWTTMLSGLIGVVTFGIKIPSWEFRLLATEILLELDRDKLNQNKTSHDDKRRFGKNGSSLRRKQI
jgi:hypothetical protein